MHKFSGHQFHTLCVNNVFVPTTAWPQMTSEWRHVRVFFMQIKGLKESLSWTQFLSFNQFLCKKWRRIDRPTKLISLIFTNVKNNYSTIFKKVHFSHLSKSVFLFALTQVVQKLLTKSSLVLKCCHFDFFDPCNVIFLPDLEMSSVKIVELVRPYPMPFTTCLQLASFSRSPVGGYPPPPRY